MLDEKIATNDGAKKGLNRQHSVEIYSQLMNGKMVNRTILTEGALRSNPLFEELLNHFDRYQDHYGLMGYELIMRDGFAWRGETYGSLSRVARAITGTNWNGHRFFGLQRKQNAVKVQTRPSPRSDGSKRPRTEARATEAGHLTGRLADPGLQMVDPGTGHCCAAHTKASSRARSPAVVVAGATK